MGHKSYKYSFNTIKRGRRASRSVWSYGVDKEDFIKRKEAHLLKEIQDSVNKPEDEHKWATGINGKEKS